jgi:hypothetical protein
MTKRKKDNLASLEHAPTKRWIKSGERGQTEEQER